MPAHTLQGKRLQLTNSEGKKVYYDIDPDDFVYWLRLRRDNKIQRYRVHDHELAEEIRQCATRAAESNESTS